MDANTIALVRFFLVAAPVTFVGLYIIACIAYSTTIKEGTAVVIERNGQFDRFVMVWHGYFLNDPNGPWYDEKKPKWAALPNPYGPNSPELISYRSFFPAFMEGAFNLYWIGLFNRVRGVVPAQLLLPTPQDPNDPNPFYYRALRYLDGDKTLLAPDTTDQLTKRIIDELRRK